MIRPPEAVITIVFGAERLDPNQVARRRQIGGFLSPDPEGHGQQVAQGLEFQIG
jgi:hypothetical protein